MRTFAASAAAFVLVVAAGSTAVAAEDRSQLPQPARPCAVCHGNEGISELPGIPNLAGQKAGYLVKQTTEMHLSARALLGLRPRGALGPPTRHESLWTEHRACPTPGVVRGAKSAIVGRCATCHGEDGVGATPNVPNLAGQHRLYLVDQIQKMRSAEWGEVFIDADAARATGIMGPQAVQVPEDQIDVLALWFAASPCAEKK